MGEVKGKAAQVLPTREKITGLGLTADPKGTSGAVRQARWAVQWSGTIYAYGEAVVTSATGLSTSYPHC